MARRSLALALVPGLTLALAACVTPVAGPEFQVNTTTAGTQSAPAVASVGPDSNFVIVWSAGGGQDGDETGIFGRMFDASGAPLGGEFQVNTVTAGYQDRPSVASNATGNFVVSWTHLSGAPGYEIRARRFDSSGTPQDVEIVVNTYTTGTQAASDVAIDAAGNFVVVWAGGPDQDGDEMGVFGRRFDATGNPLGTDFQINQDTEDSQTLPRIAMSPAGDFIVTWQSPQDLSDGGVVARRYAANGNPLGGEFLVNRTEEFGQGEPDVALDAAGNAIIVWTSYAQDGDGQGVYGQRLDPSGNKIGPEFNINSLTTAFQGRPRVAAAPSPDRFTVTWQSNSAAGDPGIASQEFDQTGRRSMMEMPVNSYGTAAQIQPAIAAQPNGQIVIAWASEGADGSDFGVSARVGGFPRVEFTRVDVPHTITGSSPAGASNNNGVLEAGEHVNVEPAYRNLGSGPLTLTETLTSVTGLPGPTYSMDDDTADFGTLDPGELDDCFGNTGGCFTIGVVGTRPEAQHADVQLFTELSYHAFERAAAVHIGESFPDVPVTNPFYAFIENLFHNEVTGGCAGGNYCPANPVTRAQMAVFLLKARWGAGFLPAPATGAAFPDVPADNLFAPWIEELVREGITAGCGNGNYCPDNPVTRQQMAIFLLKTKNGAAYAPPAGVGLFGDVSPCPGVVCNFIEDLYNQDITGGCNLTPLLYCPGNPVVRQQMAVFLVKTFGLQLN